MASSLSFLASAKGCGALKEWPLGGRLGCKFSASSVANTSRGKAFTVLSMCNNAIATAAVPSASGLNKCCRVSPQLQRIVGEAELPRNQVVKQVWAYIKERNLQNPNSRTEIVCDEAMSEIFGVEKIGHMELNRLLSNHLTYEGASKRPKPAPKPKAAKPVTKSTPSSIAGIAKPVRISEALRKFLGVAETEMSRPQVVKLLWDYIKEHKLQDSNNKRNVICDTKLRDLLQCESLLGITLSKYLAPHFVKE